MTQVANRSAASTAIASLGNLKAGLQNVASTIVTPGGTPILRMLKDGSWVYGAENVEVEEGSLWAVNIYSLEHGFVSWTDNPGGKSNEIVGEVMVPMTSPLPNPSTLNDTGWSWSQQLAVELRCMNGEDSGTTVVYKVTSVGGMNALKALVSAIMKQLDIEPEKPVAILSLDTDSYMHKKYGKTYVPIMAVDHWIELTDDAPEVEKQAEPKEEAAPARGRTRAAAAPAEKPKTAAAQTGKAAVEPTAEDRKRALLAELAAMDGDTEEGDQTADDGDADGSAADAAPAADENAPRRRRRA